MNWNGKFVAVTGAGGFIGSHLAEKLVTLGANVIALTEYNSNGSHGWLDESDYADDMDIHHCDIRDSFQMDHLLGGCDIVFHLAALISVPHSVKAPRSYFDTNVMGTMNVMQGSKSCDRFIHTSTSEVYGSSQTHYMGEDHPIVPQSPYAASKVAADAVVTSFSHTYGLPAVILRPFNTFGPRQSERAFIPAMIRQFLDIQIEQIKVGNLTPERDFTYVDDTVAAYIALAETRDSIDDAQVFNGGTGKSIAMSSVIKYIGMDTGIGKSVVADIERERRDGFEVDRLCSSAMKIAPYWIAEKDFAEGLGLTIDWWKKRLNNLRADTGYQI